MAWKNLREEIADDIFGDESFHEALARHTATQSDQAGEGSADRKARLLAEGLCPSCGMARDGHTQLCSWCAKKHTACVDDYRDRLRKLGACANCGAATGRVGKWKCVACTKALVVANAERRARWRSAGLCVECGKPPAAPGRRLCRPHADVTLARYHARKVKAASTPKGTRPSTSGPRHTSPSSAPRP